LIDTAQYSCLLPPSCTSQLSAWLVKKGHSLFDYRHVVFKEAREVLLQDKGSKRGAVLASTPFADSDRSPTNLLLITDARLRTSPSPTIELNDYVPEGDKFEPIRYIATVGIHNSAALRVSAMEGA
jgi:hypothetical protein